MKHLLLVFALALSVVGCASIQRNEARYLKKIIFPREELLHLREHGHPPRQVYVDSVLKFRPMAYEDYQLYEDTFFVEGRVYDVKPVQLIIPRKWGDKYVYFHGNLEKALSSDSTDIVCYSPLLKSASSDNLYYLQAYQFGIITIEGEKYWEYERVVYRFEINGRRIVKLEPDIFSYDAFGPLGN